MNNVTKGNFGGYNPSPMSQNQRKLEVDVNTLPDVLCKECDCPYFEEAVRFKRLSALVSPTGQEAIAPIQVFVCKTCGALLKPE